MIADKNGVLAYGKRFSYRDVELVVSDVSLEAPIPTLICKGSCKENSS